MYVFVCVRVCMRMCVGAVSLAFLSLCARLPHVWESVYRSSDVHPWHVEQCSSVVGALWPECGRVHIAGMNPCDGECE